MQNTILKLKGLYSHPNQLSEVPEGALNIADNVVIDSPSLAESRRGFSVLTDELSDTANIIIPFKNELLAQWGENSCGYYHSASGFVEFDAAVEPPEGVTLRYAESNGNLYVTSSEGILKLEDYDSEPVLAGVPKGLGSVLSLNSASGGFVDNDTQVAYRVVWGIKDANGNLLLGAPGQRELIANSSGGAKDVDLEIQIPDGISLNHFYQVYRSVLSDAASTEPNDELALVYEDNPSSAELIAGTISITDRTPDSLRGANLYTNQSQEGILQANDNAPFAEDVASFKNSLFFGNTKSRHRSTLTLISVGGASGLAEDDIIYLTRDETTIALTAKATEDYTEGEFAVDTSGTPSQNIDLTARSLVRVINLYSANSLVYAYYLSGFNDLPGRILLEERTLGGNPISITSTNGRPFNPVLPESGTSVETSNDVYQNGLYFSKTQQPEAVPLTNQFFIGSSDKKIQRIIPLRDSLFILKEDGIFRVTGEGPSSFRVEPLDNTVRILGSKTAVALSNQIYALSDQGVITISDTGVAVISRPIENLLLEVFGKNLEGVKSESFGIAYESDRKYILFMPTTASDTFPTQAFVYNFFTNAWTRWPMNKKCGVVNPADDRLYLGDAVDNVVNKERKSFSFRDYIDEGQTRTIVSIADNIFTLDSVANITEGDLIYQSDTVNAVITEVDVTNVAVTVNYVVSEWEVGEATVFQAIECTIEWTSQTGENPGVTKLFREACLFFKNNSFFQCRLGFKTELSASLEYVDFDGAASTQWGLFAWGSIPWGGQAKGKPVRTYIPLEKSRCSDISPRFYCRSAFSKWQLQGLQLVFNFVSERLTR